MATYDHGILAAGIVHPSPERAGLTTLPLNLLAQVLSYVEDTRDLANLCCSCRLLHYMALPQLCKHIVLTSYDRIRFRDNMSEGCGSASPFSMGLNAIVSRNLGPLVRSFTLRGSWAETELEEHSRLGRVPESSMMLNIAVRAALNEMTNLEFFAWQLNTKALDTVYRGLAQASKLKALTIRFPSSRHPRPTTSIPPMPQLESLKVTDIDPLCYPDDISALVAYSPKLNDLKLHWSPRIKRSQEPSVRLSEYFRKCVTRGKPLRLRSVSFQNFYAPYSDEIDNAFDMTCLEEMHILDSPGIFTTDYVPVSFVETSWANPNCFHKHNLKCLRHDHLDKKVAWMISRISALEQLYYITPIRNVSDYINRPREPQPQDCPPSLPSADELNEYCLVSLLEDKPVRIDPVPPTVVHAHKALQDTYLSAIFSVHGPSLRHLLLPSRWTLPKDIILRLARECPNLRQLGFAAEVSSIDSLNIVRPYLQNLRALRLLIPTTGNRTTPSPCSPTAAGLQSPTRTPSKTPAGQDDGINNVRDPHSNEVDLSKITDLNARAMAELADLDDRIHTHCMGLSVSHGLMCNNLKILSIGWKAYEVGEIQRITYDEVLMGSPCRVRTTTTGPEKCTTGSEPACTSTIPLQGRSDRPKRKLPHDFPPSPLTDSQSSSKRRSDANDHRTTLAATVPTAPICGTTIPVWSDVNDTLDGASSTDSLDGKTNSSDVPFPTFDFCDPSSYITVSGHRLSKPARDEVTRSVNLLRSLKPQEDGYVLKRRVRRVGMEVLRRWEIFALDTQQI